MVARKFIYRGVPFQKGGGIGSLVGSLFKTLVPALSRGASSLAKSPSVRRALSTAGKEAVKAGANAVTSVVQGQSAKPVLKKSLHRAKKRIAAAALKGHCPSPAPKKMKHSKKKRTKKKDIFSLS